VRLSRWLKAQVGKAGRWLVLKAGLGETKSRFAGLAYIGSGVMVRLVGWREQGDLGVCECMQ
jgi:hypothetical protein